MEALKKKAAEYEALGHKELSEIVRLIEEIERIQAALEALEDD